MANSGNRLVRASAVVGIGTLLSRVTGLARTAALVGVLGTTSALADTYNTGNGLPNIVYELVLGGVLSATLVPLFVRRIEEDDREGIAAILTAGVIALAALAVVSVLAAPLVTAGLAFNKPPEVRAVMTVLLRWFLPQVFFYGIIALATGLLNARRRYALAAFAPALNNVTTLCLLLAMPTFVEAELKGGGALAAARAEPRVLTLLGLGTTAGVALSALVVVPAMPRRLATASTAAGPAQPRAARTGGAVALDCGPCTGQPGRQHVRGRGRLQPR